MTEHDMWSRMIGGNGGIYTQAFARLLVPVVLKKEKRAADGRFLLKDGQIECDEVTLPAGTMVRAVMASRFGDVGITDDLDARHGYHLRVPAKDHANDVLSDIRVVELTGHANGREDRQSVLGRV